MIAKRMSGITGAAALAVVLAAGCTWVKPTPEGEGVRVAAELATLARNEAVSLGGDTVVAEGDAIDGRQVFGVYDCGN